MDDSIKAIQDRDLFSEGSAIVIGGSGGIGEAICETFAACGVPSIFTYYKNNSICTIFML